MPFVAAIVELAIVIGGAAVSIFLAGLVGGSFKDKE